MEDKRHNLFCYGTLADDGQEKDYVVNGKMWNVGAFPAVKLGEGRVFGQIIPVDDKELRKLDSYEGVPVLYHRIEVMARHVRGGPEIRTWIYEWSGSTNNLSEIEGGIWND